MTDFDSIKKIFSSWIESHYVRFNADETYMEIESPFADALLILYFDENGKLIKYE